MDQVAESEAINGIPISSLSPAFVAGWMYKSGEGLDSNPYPKSSDAYDKYQWEMRRLQDAELRDEL